MGGGWKMLSISCSEGKQKQIARPLQNNLPTITLKKSYQIRVCCLMARSFSAMLEDPMMPRGRNMGEEALVKDTPPKKRFWDWEIVSVFQRSLEYSLNGQESSEKSWGVLRAVSRLSFTPLQNPKTDKTTTSFGGPHICRQASFFCVILHVCFLLSYVVVRPTYHRVATVRLWFVHGTAVPVFGADDSSKEGFLGTSVEFNRKAQFRFRFRFLKTVPAFLENSSDGSSFRFLFGSWATLISWPNQMFHRICPWIKEHYVLTQCLKTTVLQRLRLFIARGSL